MPLRRWIVQPPSRILSPSQALSTTMCLIYEYKIHGLQQVRAPPVPSSLFIRGKPPLVRPCACPTRAQPPRCARSLLRPRRLDPLGGIDRRREEALPVARLAVGGIADRNAMRRADHLSIPSPPAAPVSLTHPEHAIAHPFPCLHTSQLPGALVHPGIASFAHAPWVSEVAVGTEAGPSTGLQKEQEAGLPVHWGVCGVGRGGGGRPNVSVGDTSRRLQPGGSGGRPAWTPPIAATAHCSHLGCHCGGKE